TRMAKASERQIALGRRTARVCCSIDGRCIAAEVLKNPLNHGRILDAGDHPQLPAATSANLYVGRKDDDTEKPTGGAMRPAKRTLTRETEGTVEPTRPSPPPELGGIGTDDAGE